MLRFKSAANLRFSSIHRTWVAGGIGRQDGAANQPTASAGEGEEETRERSKECQSVRGRQPGAPAEAGCALERP